MITVLWDTQLIRKWVQKRAQQKRAQQERVQQELNITGQGSSNSTSSIQPLVLDEGKSKEMLWWDSFEERV
jgi:hypothetical protein